MSTMLNQLDETNNELRRLAFKRMEELGVSSVFRELVWDEHLKYVGSASYTDFITRLRWTHRHFFKQQEQVAGNV